LLQFLTPFNGPPKVAILQIPPGPSLITCIHKIRTPYNVSLRFFLDVAIACHDITAYLHQVGQGKSLLQPDRTPMWDFAPYSKSSSAVQKLKLITAISASYDRRELVPCVLADDGDWLRADVEWSLSEPDHLMRYGAFYAGPEFLPWLPKVNSSFLKKTVPP
jgi:hypothetical protein